jgi:hypothetical protein
MDNNNRTQNNIVSNKKKKKFHDIDLDLEFQMSDHKYNREETQYDIEDNIPDESEEYEEDLGVNDLSTKGPKKQSLATFQQVNNDKLVNPLFYEIFDQQLIAPYKAELKLNYSLIKSIKEIKLSNPSLKVQCRCCPNIEFDPEWVDYKEGKFYSMICPECTGYLIVYYEVKQNEQLFYLNDSKVKVISANIEVMCNCGQAFIKEHFSSGNVFNYKKCDSCSEHISLLDCTVVTTDKVASEKFPSFTKEDVLKLFSKYGFCTTDPIKYGFKLKIESNDEKEEVDIGTSYWEHIYINKTVNRKRLIIEKVINTKK